MANPASTRSRHVEGGAARRWPSWRVGVRSAMSDAMPLAGGRRDAPGSIPPCRRRWRAMALAGAVVTLPVRSRHVEGGGARGGPKARESNPPRSSLASPMRLRELNHGAHWPRPSEAEPHWRPQEARWRARPRRSMAFPPLGAPRRRRTRLPRSRRSANQAPRAAAAWSDSRPDSAPSSDAGPWRLPRPKPAPRGAKGTEARPRRTTRRGRQAIRCRYVAERAS
jgi:hypothetical protein